MYYRATLKNSYRTGSVFVNFSFVLALVSCAASGYLFFQWKNLSAEKKGVEAVRIQLEDQIASLETDLQGSLREQQKNKLALEAAGSEKKAVLAELTEIKVSSDQLKDNLKKLTIERDTLKKLAIQFKNRAAELPVLPPSVSAGLQNTLAAGSAPAAHLKAASDQPMGVMKVKTINRTFNFVVFDLASGAVLKAGDSAVVERDGRWISDLKIKQVYAQFASADIRKEDENNLLKIGDSVKRV